MSWSEECISIFSVWCEWQVCQTIWPCYKTSALGVLVSLFNGHGVMFQKSNGMVDDLDEDGFFDLLSRFQSRRIDDQRCSFRLLESGVPSTPKSVVSDGGNKDLAALGQCPWPPTLWPCTLPSTSHSVPLLPAVCSHHLHPHQHYSFCFSESGVPNNPPPPNPHLLCS